MAKSTTFKGRRSKKTELVRYVEDDKPDEPVQSTEVAILKNMQVGQRVLLELEVTTKSYKDGPVVSLIAKEGVREVMGAIQLLKINSIETL